MKRLLILITLVCFQLFFNACNLPAKSTPDNSPSLPFIESPPTAVPSVGGFYDTGSLAAANSEVVTVKMAAQAFHLDTGSWPTDSSNLSHDGYLDKEPEETYKFNTTTGIISGVTSSGKWITAGFSFDVTTQRWE